MTSARGQAVLLDVGQTVFTGAQVPMQIGQYVGGGGQGQVFRGVLNGRFVAIKWFFPQYLRRDPAIGERIRNLLATGPPTDRFLWPLEIVSAPGTPSFGYVMPWREERFRPLRDHFTRAVKPTLGVLAGVGLELAWSFRELHGSGFSYRDISYDNCFFDPLRGEVRICDNDNVDRDGRPGGVLGTPYFMAPELVRGDARHSRSTDLFSLAVLLFYLLHVAHPLIGRRILEVDFPGDDDLRRLLVDDPLFILDPQDSRNRPMSRDDDPQGESGCNALDWWPLYPASLHALFVRAFREGLREPSARVQEGAWMTELSNFRDSLVRCPACGAENSFFVVVAPDDGSPPCPCWNCGARVPRPLHLVTSRGLVTLAPGRRLYPHHVDRARRLDFRTAVARVEAHPDHPDRLGLRNLTGGPWRVTKEDGSERLVEPERLFPLVAGRSIDFGSVSGEVHA